MEARILPQDRSKKRRTRAWKTRDKMNVHFSDSFFFGTSGYKDWEAEYLRPQ